MENFKPILFVTMGDEKKSSEILKKKALEITCNSDIRYSEKGKPYLENAGISITHDENVTALLIAPLSPVGIDMEMIKENYPSRVAERFFSDEERRAINCSKDFYRIWCQKESYVKMTGDGIAGICDFNVFSNNVIFTDLSEEISKISGKNFVFFICSSEKIIPEITVI